MKTYFFLLVVTALFIIASCKKKEQAHKEVVGEERVTVIPVAKDSAVVIDEQTWTVIDKEPEEDFKKAKENVKKKENKKAASELRHAAAYIKSEAEKAKGNIKKSLKDSEEELNKIAEKLEGGVKVTQEELSAAFKRVHARLSNEYSERAFEANKRNDNEASGKWLHGASESLKKSISWSGKKSNAKENKVANDAEAVSKKLKDRGKKQDKKLNDDLSMVIIRIKEAGGENM